MAKLSGQTIAIVGLDPAVLDATARRLGREGARLVLGAADPGHLEELAAELRWEGREVTALALGAGDARVLGPLLALGASVFGRVDAVVGGRSLDAGILPTLASQGVGRLVAVVASAERTAGLQAAVDSRLPEEAPVNLCVVASSRQGVGALQAEAVGRAVAFALAAPAEMALSTIVVRPAPIAHALRAA